MKIKGIEVEDATNHLTVTVTKEDVRKGALKKADRCAAAQAIIRETGCEDARVHVARAYVKNNGTWKRYFVPDSLRTEVVAFDRGGKFTPGDYILNPAPPSSQLRAERSPSISSRKKRKRRIYHVTAGIRDHMKADWE